MERGYARIHSLVVQIRETAAGDLDAALALNNANVPEVNELDHGALATLLGLWSPSRPLQQHVLYELIRLTQETPQRCRARTP